MVGVIVAVVVVVFVVAWILSKFTNSILKSLQSMRGWNRCMACRSRIKFASGAGYADVCRRCGADQRPLRAAAMRRKKGTPRSAT
jgi:rRNA maturation endonuclease Nob1